MDAQRPAPEETIRSFIDDFNAERWDRLAGYMHASMTVKRRPPEPYVDRDEAVAAARRSG
jgi:hypothetical protein